MTGPANPPPTSPAGRSAPAPLVVAASLTALEGLVLVLYGVAELASLTSSRLTMGVSTALFFFVYGGGLVLVAWFLVRLSSWARAPVVLAQLIQLGVAWSFWGGDSAAVAVALAGVAGLVLVGIFHPASVAALADEPR